jgi:nitrite reductase/ring-hydroxylating ferredoxin subunit
LYSSYIMGAAESKGKVDGKKKSAKQSTDPRDSGEKEDPDSVLSPVTLRTVVARKSDLREGEMREVAIGDSKALLVCQNDNITAIGHKCTHYGAPLVKGALGHGRVRCPWHGACFSVTTGDIEDYPGLDSIPCFKVVLDGDDVIIETSPKEPTSYKRTLPMVKADSQRDYRVFLLIGGGGASVACAETLRQEGFQGMLILIYMFVAA